MPAFWVRAFRRAERTMAGPLERFAESEPTIEVLIRLTGLQGDVQRRVERTMRTSLHLLNMPSLSDVRRLSQQIALLERRVRELSREDAKPPAELPESRGRAA